MNRGLQLAAAFELAPSRLRTGHPVVVAVGAPVGEMNVTSNLMALFSDLQEIGNDPFDHSMLRVPTLVFRDVQFGGT